MMPVPHASSARDALALAALAAVVIVCIMIFATGGMEAVATVAGMTAASADPFAVRLVLACDTLLPIGYGAGFTLLAFALSSPGDRALAIVTALFTFGGVACDFAENGFAIAGASVPAFTVAKYGLLGIAAFLLGAAMDGRNAVERLAAPVAKFVTPFFLAITITRALGEWTVWLFAPTLVATFALLALVAHGRVVPRDPVRSS